MSRLPLFHDKRETVEAALYDKAACFNTVRTSSLSVLSQMHILLDASVSASTSDPKTSSTRKARVIYREAVLQDKLTYKTIEIAALRLPEKLCLPDASASATTGCS